jgi:hypothetical protein
VLWDRGRGGERYLSLFMTGSDPKMVNFTNPAQSRRVKRNKCKNTASPRRAKNDNYAKFYPKVW